MDKYNKYINMNVLDSRVLKKNGYDPKKYYCGNYSLQCFYTKIRDDLVKLGIKFPFNKACFKHDNLYSSNPTIKQKIYIDYVFLKDMIKLLNSSRSEKVAGNRSNLIKRMIFFYIMVNLLTPIRWLRNKIKR